MSRIAEVHGRQILDSRGNPTVEVDVGSSPARSAAPRFPPAPRPASTRRSSCATATPAYGGKGVAQAVANVNGELARRAARRRRARPGRGRRAR